MTRTAMEEEGDDKLLIAEHFHDAGPDLDGDGWHGAMNYSAFMKPVWSWLVAESFDRDWLGMPTKVPSTTGRQMVASIQSFAARMPSLEMTSSHFPISLLKFAHHKEHSPASAPSNCTSQITTSQQQAMRRPF